MICCGYLLESPQQGDSNRLPQHMILLRNYHFYRFNTNPRFPPFLLYVKCKSGVTFVQRCFSDNRKNETQHSVRIFHSKRVRNFVIVRLLYFSLLVGGDAGVRQHLAMV